MGSVVRKLEQVFDAVQQDAQVAIELFECEIPSAKPLPPATERLWAMDRRWTYQMQRQTVRRSRGWPSHSLDYQFTSRLTCCAQPRFRRIRSTGNLNSRSAARVVSLASLSRNCLQDSRFRSLPGTAFDQLFHRRNHHEQKVCFRPLCTVQQRKLLLAP
jgi:hypothetical protein